MHPMFNELFIQTNADDLAAEEDRQRRVRRSQRARPTMMNMNSARCQALFSSPLQPSDAPTADTVATAIGRAIQQFGIDGCAGRMAQEFGDHPDAAASRMRWVRQLLAQRPATWQQAAA
jgi:hypothetical protein